MKLKEIARRIECRLDGDGDVDILRIVGLEEAAPGDLTFFANPKYGPQLKSTRASAVIVAESLEPSALPERTSTLRTSHPYVAFARAAQLFAPRPSTPVGIHSLASVAASASIGDRVSIAAFVTIGDRAMIGAGTIVYPHVTIGEDAQIGEDCIIHAQVSIRERVVLGNRVVVQDGAVIGSDGFGFAKGPDGAHHKIPQVGGVVVEDDVEIGANAAIDRPAVGETRIGTGTKIDNLVQVAHGVKLGRNVVLASQVGIAGSTRIENNVTLAGQVGVAGHLTVGEGVVATAQTGIPNSVDAGSFVSGYPAIPNRDWLKSSAVFHKLPALRKAVTDLQRRLDELEARLNK